MSRLRFGVSRYASVTRSVEERLPFGGRASRRLGELRVHVLVRGVGASKWERVDQLAPALDAAKTVRAILGADSRLAVRNYAQRAVVVCYVDVAVVRGCSIRTEWECIVPAPPNDAKRSIRDAGMRSNS